MARGGARPGAGRRKGTVSAQSKAKRELATRVAAEGITPLEILLVTMRDLWRDATAGPVTNRGKQMQAAVFAEKVAPYVHPKMATIDAKPPPEDDGSKAKRLYENLQAMKATVGGADPKVDPPTPA